MATAATRYMLIMCACVMAAAGPAHASPPRSRCATGPTRVYTFTVETKWSKKTYEAGDTAKVRVTVTRPAPEDPLREGLPWPVEERIPVEGATVTTNVSLSFPPVGGYGETNEDGVAAIKFRVAGHLDGPVDTYTEATETYRSGGPDCTDLEEFGGKADNPAFIVRD